MIKLNISWPVFKTINGELKIYYTEDDCSYHLFITKLNIINECLICKNINTAEKTDFETNFKTSSVLCETIDDCIAKGYNDL